MESKSYMAVTRTGKYIHADMGSSSNGTQPQDKKYYSPLFRVRNAHLLREPNEISNFLNFTVWWENTNGCTKKTFSANSMVKRLSNKLNSTTNIRSVKYQHKNFFVDETPENSDFEVIAISDMNKSNILQIDFVDNGSEVPIVNFGYTTFYVSVPNKPDTNGKHLYDNRFAQLTINKCDLLPNIEFLGMHPFKTRDECEEDSFDIVDVSDIATPGESSTGLTFNQDNTPFETTVIEPVKSDLLKNYINTLIKEYLNSTTPLNIYCDESKSLTQNQVLNRYKSKAYIDAIGDLNVDATVEIKIPEHTNENYSGFNDGFYICSIENLQPTTKIPFFGEYMGRSDSSISGVCKFIINEDGDIYYSYSTSNAINFENTFLKVRFKLSAGNYKLVLTTTDENNSDSTNTQ